MKINSDFIWAVILISVAAISFFLGAKSGALEAEDDFNSQWVETRERIEVLELENEQLSEELTSRGIFSYPQANIISQEEDSLAMVLITLNGRRELENLQVRTSTVYNYSEVLEEEMPETVKQQKPVFLGNLKAHNPSSFAVPMIEDEAAIHLAFKSERDQWQQHIRVSKAANGEIRSLWVITNKDMEVIDKHMDEGFPVGENGEVAIWKDALVKYSDIELNSVFRH